MACTPAHAAYCFDVLEAQLKGRKAPAYEGDDADEEFPLFVTWNIVRSGGSHRLRGCIGSFSALPLASGLQEYAIISAFKDRRFSPISSSELARLECDVSLLTDFEDVDDPFDWVLGEHGIYIHFEDPAFVPPPKPIESPASTDSNSTRSGQEGNQAPAESSLRNRLDILSKRKTPAKGARTLSATYLPDVPTAQEWNQVETLDSAIHKAGYNGKVTDAIRQSLRVTRYRSSKASITYAEWQKSKSTA